ANGTAGVSVLFGSILGLSAGAARAAALIGVMILAGLLLITRPLLFASLDEAVAAARGVPVRAMGIGFLALVGLAAAETTQAEGGRTRCPQASPRRSMADPRGDTRDVDQVVALRLRRVGQRLTPRRRSLLQILTAAAHPLTIHEILDRGSGLAMSSAYRNLTVLEDAGVVDRVITQEDVGRYELAEELTEHHHHLVCSSCGLVRDLVSDRDAERLMNVAVRRAI